MALMAAEPDPHKTFVEAEFSKHGRLVKSPDAKVELQTLGLNQ
jgi:hypothetical protein